MQIIYCAHNQHFCAEKDCYRKVLCHKRQFFTMISLRTRIAENSLHSTLLKSYLGYLLLKSEV